MKHIDEDFTELIDADIPRVDIVGKSANGRRWALIKSADTHGLLTTGDVGNLLKEADPVEVWKAKYDADDRKKLAVTGAAMSNGSYPIEDKEDLTSAIRAVGRGGADHDSIRRHIISRAESLGATSEIPDTWNKDGSLKEGTVTKKTDTTDEAVIKDDPDLDVTELLAEPSDPLDELEAATPGSPAWEQVDADTAMKWAGILARAKAAICELADREIVESGTDPDDAGNAWNLEDVACAIDYAVSQLGGYAAGEQAEADIAGEMEAVGKSAAELEVQLPTVEALAAILKAGRTLSASNESALRTAADSIQKVLASLPAAPDDIEKKEATMAETTVVKADDAALTAVFNQSGALIGVVPADQIQAVSGAGGDASDDSDDSDDTDTGDVADDGTDADPADTNLTAEQTAATTDDEAPIPGTDTIQSPVEGDNTDVKKGALITPEVLALFGELLDPIAKKLDVNVELASTVDELKEQIEKLAKSPDDRRSPVLNGARGVAGMASRDGSTEDAHADLRKAIEEAQTPGARRDLQQQLAYASIRDRFSTAN